MALGARVTMIDLAGVILADVGTATLPVAEPPNTGRSSGGIAGDH